MKLEQRLQYVKNPTAKKLLEIMIEKKTNLAVAADLTSGAEILRILDKIGSEICVAKLHIDILTDFTSNFVTELIKLKEKHNFLIFEDRKFADIGNTVQMQYAQGIYHIVDWADITNAHTVPGPGIIEGLSAVGLPKGRGLLLLAEMTPEGTLAKGEYTQASIEMAKKYDDFVFGFITTKKLINDPKFINFTPGVKFGGGGDGLKQQYNTPAKAIAGGSDVLIVGRGIYKVDDPASEARKYRQEAWEAYLQNR
ncbi:MAG: orotidine-5'-phosphate decarboxylase [Patescibacteria group bacterium]|jgi:uridine monophosphate synthetase